MILDCTIWSVCVALFCDFRLVNHFVLLCRVIHPQLVWATSSRIGCAVNVCYNMNVWGQIWAKAVYLVCNYSPK